MKFKISYKNCLIHSESFQLGQGDWIPRYALSSQDGIAGRSSIPSYHDCLDKVFLTKKDADEFALLDAVRWIDKS